MTVIGTNVSARGEYRAADLAAAGVQCARIVALPDYDASDYLNELQAAGISPLLVLASESFHGMTWTDAAAHYAERYASLISCVQAGNEPDIESPSSWTMGSYEVNRLMGVVRNAFPNTPLVCPGLASGNPDWAYGLDLSLFDILACHPYGQGTPNWASPYGFGGHVGILIDGYRKFGKPIWITEWGANDFELGEEMAAVYTSEMLGYLNDSNKVGSVFHFAWSDAMVPGFGLLEADGSRKSTYDHYTAISAPVVAVEPAEPLPEPPTWPVATPEFKLTMGFKRIASLIGIGLVGDAVGDGFYPAPGIEMQTTTEGLLFWTGPRSLDDNGGLKNPVVMFRRGTDGRTWTLDEVTGEVTEKAA